MKRRDATSCRCAVLVLITICHCRSASCADTTETLEPRATGIDFYLGFDGIGLDKYEKMIFGKIMLGFGLIRRFSVYLGTTFEANEYFTDGTQMTGMGVFGTPVDTDHFDTDLFLDVSLGGSDLDALQVAPALELNFDRDAAMGSIGVYLRANVPIYGDRANLEDTAASPTSEITYRIEGIIGTYVTLSSHHQLLVEYDMDFSPDQTADQPSVTAGGLSLGYNLAILDSLELISQLSVDLPERDQPFSLSVIAGFISTIPMNYPVN